jgi:hypothetical protein
MTTGRGKKKRTVKANNKGHAQIRDSHGHIQRLESRKRSESGECRWCREVQGCGKNSRRGGATRKPAVWTKQAGERPSNSLGEDWPHGLYSQGPRATRLGQLMMKWRC